jgi:hypothetical protein
MLPLLIALALVSATRLPAQNVEEPLALEAAGGLVEGYIDWTANELVVYGEAVAPESITNPVQRRLLGFRAAKAVAYRNLLEMVGQVQVDAETRVQNVVLASDSISVRVKGIIRGARVVTGSQVESAGLYRIALRLPLLGKFADAVLPEVAPLDRDPLDMVLPPSPLPESADESLAVEEEPVVFVPQEPYTGLLIDARGLGLQPSMSPQILSENGRIIYGAATVDRGYATQYGIVGYDKDIDRALTNDRLGGESANPFVVKATGTSGLYNGDVVVGDFDATRVLMSDDDGEFLRECRVVFILGPEPVVIDSTYMDSTMLQALPPEEDAFELQGETEPGDQPQ